MWRKMLTMVIVLLTVSACSKAQTNPVDDGNLLEVTEQIESRVFDYEEAIASIEKQRTEKLLPIKGEDMNSYEQRYEYSIATDSMWFYTIYGLENDNHYDGKIEFNASIAQPSTTNDNFKDNLAFLFKKFFTKGPAKKINRDGFKGHYSYVGPKLDELKMVLEKDGVQYNYGMGIKIDPKDAAKEVDRLDNTDIDDPRWIDLKESFLKQVKLPTKLMADFDQMTIFDYDDENAYALKLDVRFKSEINHTFIVRTTEEVTGMTRRDILNKDDIEEVEQWMDLADGGRVEVKTNAEESFIEEKMDKAIYNWEDDGLYYTLIVNGSPRTNILKTSVADFHLEYKEIIESVE